MMDEKNQNIDEIKQRILYFAENQNIKKGFLYKKIGLCQSNFSGNGASSSLKSENLIKVLNAFPELNPDWLLLGNGKMLRKSSVKIKDPVNRPSRCDNDSKEEFIIPVPQRLDDDITRGLIASIQSLTHAIEKLTDKLCDL